MREIEISTDWGTCTAAEAVDVCSPEASYTPGRGLTREVLALMVADVRAGLPHVSAAARRRVPSSTLASWMRRGRATLALYCDGRADALTLEAELVVELARADAESEASLVQTVLSAEDPTLALKVLRARYPTRWAGAKPDPEPEARPATSREILDRRLRALERAQVEVDEAELAVASEGDDDGEA